MKKGNSKKKIGLLAIIAIVLVMAINTTEADATTKPTLWQTNATIGVGNSYLIDIDNQKTGATYSYTSKNKKVATVNKKGEIKALKKGKAKIVVKQTYKKKKTNVGTFTITVKQSCIYTYCKTGLWISAQTGRISATDPHKYEWYDFVQYANPKAKYKFYSSNPKKLKINTNGKVTAVNGTGTVSVTIKETYKKKTRKVGSFKLSLKAPTLTQKGKTVCVYKTQTLNLNDYMKYTGRYGVVWVEQSDLTKSEVIEELDNNIESDDDDILKAVEDEDGKWDGTMRCLKAGTRYIYIAAYNYKTKKFDQYLGMFTVEVKEENTATEVSLKSYDEDDYNYYYDDEDDYGEVEEEQKTDYTANSGKVLKIPLYAKPYCYTGNIEVTSSDVSVVSLGAIISTKMDKDSGKIADMYFCTGKGGIATVTVKLNGAELSFTVKVKTRTLYTGDEDALEIYNYLGIEEDVLSDSDYKVESSNPDVVTVDFETDDEIYCEIYTYAKSAGTATVTVYYKGQVLTTMDVEVTDY